MLKVLKNIDFKGAKGTSGAVENVLYCDGLSQVHASVKTYFKDTLKIAKFTVKFIFKMCF